MALGSVGLQTSSRSEKLEEVTEAANSSMYSKEAISSAKVKGSAAEAESESTICKANEETFLTFEASGGCMGGGGCSSVSSDDVGCSGRVGELLLSSSSSRLKEVERVERDSSRTSNVTGAAPSMCRSNIIEEPECSEKFENFKF